MSPASLFSLVHRLSEDQILVFRNWIRKHSRSGKKKLKYVQLFNRILRLTDFDEEKLRKAPFEDPTVFYHSRELLLQKLIECFSNTENPVLSHWNYIQTAVSFGAIEIAKTHFKWEFEQVEKRGEQDKMLALCRYREQILRDYKEDLGEGIDIPKAKSIAQELASEEQAIALVDQARAALRKEEKLRMGLRREIKDFLNQFDRDSSFWSWKLKIATELLKYDFSAAGAFQMEMVERINKNEIQATLVEKLRELSNAVTIALHLKKREAATRYLFLLSQTEPQNEIERRIKLEGWTRHTVESAFTFGDPNMAKEGIQAMQKYPTIFPEYTIALYHYITSLAFFLEEDWNGGHAFLTTAFSLPASTRKHLPWQFEVLDLFYQLEKGNHDYILSVLDSKRKRFRKSPYVAIVLKGLDLILRNQGKIDRELIAKMNLLTQKLPSTQALEESRVYFNIQTYLEAKEANQPLKTAFGSEIGRQILSLAI